MERKGLFNLGGGQSHPLVDFAGNAPGGREIHEHRTIFGAERGKAVLTEGFADPIGGCVLAGLCGRAATDHKDEGDGGGHGESRCGCAHAAAGFR